MSRIFNNNIDDMLNSVKNMYAQEQSRVEYWKKKYEEYSKDEEVERLQSEIDRVRRNSLLILSDKERDSIQDFSRKHYEKHGRLKTLNTYIYTLSGVGIGTTISIKCPVCGEEKDVTDTESW